MPSESRRGRGRPYDALWCVFDVDERPKLPEALDLARRHEIAVAISIRCIALWFLLHFERQMAFIGRWDAQGRAEAILGCSKVLTDHALQMLFERNQDAIVRALELDKKHAGDGLPPGSNPSNRPPRWGFAIRVRESPTPRIRPLSVADPRGPEGHQPKDHRRGCRSRHSRPPPPALPG